MKNDELDFDVLENADNSTINELLEKYPPVTEKDIERLYERSEQIYSEKSAENGAESVSGVEKYCRPIRRKIGAFAAVLVLIAGIGAGGMLIFRDKPYIEPSDSDKVSETSGTALARAIAPFGDISGGRMRFLTPAYVPYLLDVSAEDTAELAKMFNFWLGEEADGDAPYPDGEQITAYIENGDSHFRLIFYTDNTMDCEKDGNTVRYKLTEEIAETVYRLAHPTEQNILRHLIPCKMEDITVDGVWKNNEPVPEKIFEASEPPEELKDMEIIDCEPLYEYAYDFENIQKNAENASNIIVGRVDSISYKSRQGTAYTQVNITVTGDVLGEVQAGESVCIETVGGYVSIYDTLTERNNLSVISDSTTFYRDNNGNSIPMNDIAANKVYHHEIVESGEVPIINKEYAFFVNNGPDASKYESVGLEYGMLYKCDNLYIQRNSQGFNYYDFDELRAMLE